MTREVGMPGAAACHVMNLNGFLWHRATLLGMSGERIKFWMTRAFHRQSLGDWQALWRSAKTIELVHFAISFADTHLPYTFTWLQILSTNIPPTEVISAARYLQFSCDAADRDITYSSQLPLLRLFTCYYSPRTEAMYLHKEACTCILWNENAINQLCQLL